MADGIIYLDVDDEITSAAARIRAVEGRRAAVVLPHGSRVATSRINFRLLSRDALTHEKRLAIVAADGATRALAASAGLPVYASVAEYEAAMAAERAESSGGGGAAAGAVGAAGLAGAAGATGLAGAAGAAGAALSRPGDPAVPSSPDTPATKTPATTPPDTEPDEEPLVPAPAAAVSATTATVINRPDATSAQSAPARSTTHVVSKPSGAPRGIGRPTIGRAPLLIGLAVLGLAVVVGGVGAYLFLPTATITVTPREESIGPLVFEVEASTAITEPDVEAGTIPAETLTVDVDASDTFEATGQRVEETAATGEVRFDNLDPTSSNAIPAGSVVSTGSGIRFATDSGVTVPAAKLVGLTIVPSSASVAITAVDPGPEGNVPVNAITVVPRGEQPFFLKVVNPEDTAGGTREEFPRVTQEDVDAAMATLTDQLGTAFTDIVESGSLETGESTVFPETAVLGEPVFPTDPSTFVGQEVATFDLAATAAGTVLAVDTAPVEDIAEQRLAAEVDDDHLLVEGSTQITVDPAVVSGTDIRFPVSATARQVAVLDAAALEALVLGQPVADAQAALEAYGEVDIEVWPEWVATIPTIDARVEVIVPGDPP